MQCVTKMCEFSLEKTALYFAAQILIFTPLTSSPHSVPSFYQSANIGWHFGVKEDGEQGRTEECRWTGIRTEGTEEQQVPYIPAPSAGFVPSLCKILRQLAQIRPMREQPSAQETTITQEAFSWGERRRGQCTVYPMYSSRWINHEGADIPHGLFSPKCFELQRAVYNPACLIKLADLSNIHQRKSALFCVHCIYHRGNRQFCPH